MTVRNPKSEIPSLKAVLFDLDGTLLDTLEDLADSMNAVLAEFHLPGPALERHKFMVGDGVRNYILRALPADRRGDEALIARIDPVYRARYAAHWADKTRPYDGIEEMLSALTKRGLRLAVLSNKPEEFTRRMVSHFLGGFHFEKVHGAREHVSLKPHPGAALAIAEEMRLQPAEFLYLGDTNTDMQTARSAGMFAVGALWGFRPREELLQAGAQKLIERPMELMELATGLFI